MSEEDGYRQLKKAARALPLPPKAKESELSLDSSIGKYDGRKARNTGRTSQFNPKVRPEFLERFRAAQAQEEEESGEKMTQAYFLDLLLARYEKDHGISIVPFGLSEATFAGVRAISQATGQEAGVVIETAIAKVCRELDLIGKMRKGR
jgi:hypothetical protein